MLTTEPTPEMIAQWKRIFEKYRFILKPNRNTGAEVDGYFRGKYSYRGLDGEDLQNFFLVAEYVKLSQKASL